MDNAKYANTSKRMYNCLMELPQDKWDYDFNPERIKFFAKLRMLIMEKEKENDTVAAAVLGWALERFAED